MAKKEEKDGSAETPAAEPKAAAKRKAPAFYISTPVSNYKGTRAGVSFVAGKGTTNDPALAIWFKGLGFTVTDSPPEEPAEQE